MQISLSQIGISAAMLRFSNRAVPVGNVPSTGSALTGKQVALAAHEHCRDALHKTIRSIGARGQCRQPSIG